MDKTKHEIKKAINRFVRHKGTFPTLQEVCSALNFSSDQAKKYMEALAADGYVEKINDWYRFPEEKKEVVIIEEKMNEAINPDYKIIVGEKTADFLKENYKGDISNLLVVTPQNEPSTSIEPSITLDKYKDGPSRSPKPFKELGKSKIKEFSPTIEKAKNKINKIDWAMILIRYGMSIVGVCALILSVYYNSVEASHYLNPILAIVFSGMIVLFSVSAFETIIYIFSQKNMKKWIKTLIIFCFSLLWGIGLTISMSSVVAGRYAKYTENQLSKSKEVSGFSNDQFRWQEYEKQKNLLQQRISEKQNQLAQLYKITGSVQDIKEKETHGNSYAETQWRITNIENEIKKIDFSLNDIRTKEHDLLIKNPELISSATISTTGVAVDFYSWVSEVTGVDKNKIQFILALSPAAAIDILSPIAIAIALFLRKRK